MNLYFEKVLGFVLPKIFNPLSEDVLIFKKIKEINELPETLSVSSPDFETGQTMPWSCGGEGVGENKSPGLKVSNIPDDAKQLIFIMEDLDVPLPSPILHSVAYNLGTKKEFPQGYFDKTNEELCFGLAFRGELGWQGPRPIVNHGPHRYYIEFYAVDEEPTLASKLKIEDVIEIIKTKGICRGHLIGTFERTDAKYKM